VLEFLGLIEESMVRKRVSIVEDKRGEMWKVHKSRYTCPGDGEAELALLAQI